MPKSEAYFYTGKASFRAPEAYFCNPEGIFRVSRPLFAAPLAVLRMTLVLFWIFAALMLGAGLAVILNRNPVGSAMCLVISFLGLAALFTMLDAFFIGTIQILVYGGAVMVLFLFIIMLLDLRADRRRDFRPAAFIGGLLVAGFFTAQLLAVLRQLPPGMASFPPLAEGKQINDVHDLGMKLFSHFTLPFQVVGTLILVASVGVVVLSKKELK